MSSYVIYDQNGKILDAHIGSSELSDDQYDNINTFALECEFNIAELQDMVVDNGVLRQKTQAEIDSENAPFVTIQFREERDGLLASSDWTQSPDSPLTDAKKQEWATYRQALRDLPANTVDPANPTWPTQPS